MVSVKILVFTSSGDDEINLAGGLSKFVTDIAVDHKGRCVWSGPATFKVNCKMEISEWPFDEQICELAFGSYTYGKNLLIIRLFRDKRGDFASKESPFVPLYHLTILCLTDAVQRPNLTQSINILSCDH